MLCHPCNKSRFLVLDFWTWFRVLTNPPWVGITEVVSFVAGPSNSGPAACRIFTYPCKNLTPEVVDTCDGVPLHALSRDRDDYKLLV